VSATVPPINVIPPLSQGFDSSLGGDGPTLSWLMEAVTEGEAFLAAQPGFAEIGRSIDAINSQDQGPFDPKATLSQTSTNRIAKIA
jgi:hypothetical protein